MRDGTGKVHGEFGKDIPKYARPEWTPEQLEESANELQESIRTRKLEQLRLGEEAQHRARIGQEETLLRSILKKLEDLF
jgi:hypothetical protein